jgi:hypothetical protein
MIGECPASRAQSQYRALWLSYSSAGGSESVPSRPNRRPTAVAGRASSSARSAWLARTSIGSHSWRSMPRLNTRSSLPPRAASTRRPARPAPRRPEQRRLADPGRSLNQDRARRARDSRGNRLLEQSQLGSSLQECARARVCAAHAQIIPPRRAVLEPCQSRRHHLANWNNGAMLLAPCSANDWIAIQLQLRGRESQW